VRIATDELINRLSVPVNLPVMAEVGRQDQPTFTWNPVEQMWVQERGGAAKPPPAPHDVHAIQTWFLDPDANEWIQTVLGPMGRQLAAQWKGAYRVPQTAVVRKSKAQPKRNPLVFVAAAAVLVALIGGVAVAAPGLMGSAANASAAPSTRPPVTNPSPQPNPGGSPETSAPPAATAEPTAEPTSDPGTTPRPATPRPATPRPATPAPTPKPATPPPDFVSPVAAPIGTVFHFTFTGLPSSVTYKTTYTRGSVVTGYANGEVPLNGTVNLDLRTDGGSFPPDTYFMTIRAGNVIKTVSFRITG
jgi:hypothetical protein